MPSNVLPVEAISGLWEIICCAGTMFAVAVMWIAQPR
jgi:hypothetical protein